eukprot:scaffold2152_cov252-Pinguiococcus_pyrenoidosus.AAC.8
MASKQPWQRSGTLLRRPPTTPAHSPQSWGTSAQTPPTAPAQSQHAAPISLQGSAPAAAPHPSHAPTGANAKQDQRGPRNPRREKMRTKKRIELFLASRTAYEVEPVRAATPYGS